MQKEHIVSAFDNDLAELESKVIEMGGLVEKQLADATTALARGDVELADKIIAADKRIDKIEDELNTLSVRILALRQPMAADLRAIVAALKIAGNLERIGDYAKNIAKRVKTVSEFSEFGASTGTLKRMSRTVQQMIADVLDAYINRHIDKAEDVRLRDEEVDQMHNNLFRALLTYMMEDPRNISPCMHLLFIAKNIERMGDHTTSIADQVYFVIKGSLPDDERPKGDKTSYTFVAPDEAAGS